MSMRTRLVWVLAASLPLAACGDNEEATNDCDVPGHACTWLGIAGEEGFNGDGHHRLDTKIYWSFDMLFASDGTPWFIDWNNHIVRRVLPDDTVQTVLGWTDPIFPGDGAPGENTDTGALGTDVKLNHPTDLAEAPDGTILVMAWHNHKLRKIDPSTGRAKIVCGAGAGFAGDGMDASLTLFKQPKALERDGNDLYILDQQNLRVRKIDGATNVITTVAGNGTAGFGGDGGPATMAMLGFEAGSNPEPSGGLAVAGGRLYIADTLNHRIRVVDLASGTIDTLAGTGEGGYSGDGGQAAGAQLNHPRDLEIGPEGDLYVADTDNNRVRAIHLEDGTIRTVAGTGQLGLDPDDDRLATETALARPFAIEFDPDGNLYISDTINSRILRVAR
jgi:DNA-binding beta-propeller fold protein YncE